MGFAVFFFRSNKIYCLCDLRESKEFSVGVHFHPTEQYCQEPSINVSFYFSNSLNVRWQKNKQTNKTKTNKQVAKSL